MGDNGLYSNLYDPVFDAWWKARSSTRGGHIGEVALLPPKQAAQAAWRAALEATEVAPSAAPNTRMAAALWRELRRRQSNGLVPLRVDWIAVTKQRLNAAVAALRHA
jgi:hypothetical protein